jgi:hypothetical protein
LWELPPVDAGTEATPGRRDVPRSAEWELRELPSGPDAELLVGVAQVVLHGSRAEEQPGGDVAVAESGTYE